MAIPTKKRIGVWDMPSGGTLDVWVMDGGPQHGELFCEWPTFPPPQKDQDFYRANVQPALVPRVMQALGIEGRAALIEPGTDTLYVSDGTTTERVS